jgi:hypothetical protein
MLCGPALIESDSMAEALRLLFADALRLNAERSSAALRLAGGTEKTSASGAARQSIIQSNPGESGDAGHPAAAVNVQ